MRLPIINPKDGPADWRTMALNIAVTKETPDGIQLIAKEVLCVARGPFAIYPAGLHGMIGEKSQEELGNVDVFHVATGVSIASHRHGTGAYRIAEALQPLSHAFVQPFDQVQFGRHLAAIVEIIKESGGNPTF